MIGHHEDHSVALHRGDHCQRDPVLPDVGSISVSPGLMSPRFSASTIIESAGRSFTEPPGLFPSSLPEDDVRRLARNSQQADERRVADGGFERGVHGAARGSRRLL
jgi:hypothetical protein